MVKNKFWQYVIYSAAVLAVPAIVNMVPQLSTWIGQIPDYPIMGISLVSVGLGALGIWAVEQMQG